MTAPDVFLSYNREDQTVAKRFADAFDAAGLSVWWDVTLRSGEAYDAVTEEALRSAKAVVVLWSKKSVVSRWVRAEATLADRSRTLVPVRIEACDLPIMFELTQTADLSRWQGDLGDSAWNAFLGDVRRIVGTMPEARHAPSQPATKAPSRGNKPSIAVLPFINRSGRAEDDIFADCMVEDLSAALSLSKQMKVIAASATATYRSVARELRQIGHELGVRYLLEGNVRLAGSDLRVTAQLVEAEEGNILWTQKFDRPLAEVGSLQEELVTEVAACLGVGVQRAEMELALRKPDNITAWEAVLRAESCLARFSASGAAAAIAEARRAIEIDPTYDAPYAVMAVAQGLIWAYDGWTNDALAREALDTIARARSLDSGDPIVLARIARAMANFGMDQDALPLARRAVAINPNLDVPHLALGGILVGLGDPEGALVELKIMERLAPDGIWSPASLAMQSYAHFAAGCAAQSLKIVEQSHYLADYLLANIHRAVCLATLDRWNEARDAMLRLRNNNPHLTFTIVAGHARNNVYKGMSPVRIEECCDLARRLWEETGGVA